MREKADILVLDEPTAALDAEAEHGIFERFRALTKGRTSILISHRFPTVKMADRIVVIERGHVLEMGTHEELVRKGGRVRDAVSTPGGRLRGCGLGADAAGGGGAAPVRAPPHGF